MSLLAILDACENENIIIQKRSRVWSHWPMMGAPLRLWMKWRSVGLAETCLTRLNANETDGVEQNNLEAAESGLRIDVVCCSVEGDIGPKGG